MTMFSSEKNNLGPAFFPATLERTPTLNKFETISKLPYSVLILKSESNCFSR